MISTTDEFPGDATELARIVIDSDLPAFRREGAWALLVPIIQEIAQQNAGFYREALEDAVGMVWEKHRNYDPNRGSFQSWCAIVLYRHAVDLRRRNKRGAAPFPPGECEEKGAGCLDRAAESDEFVDPLVDRMKRLRAALKRLSLAFVPSPHGTDYFAVLLLKLRLAMAEQVNPADVLDVGGGRFVEFLAWCLPWTGIEPARRFRAGWPPLSVIWNDLEGYLERPPHGLDGSALCERLSHLRGAAITPDVWNHWVNRAKKVAQSSLPYDEWETLFARFFPDRRSRSCRENEAIP